MLDVGMVVGKRVLRRGQVVNGRYRVEELAGCGGMGVVVRGLDLETMRPVALKMLRQQRDKDVRRLLREARLIAGLRSSHVARLYEASTFVVDGVEIPFLALEYIDGVDLATWLRAKGSLDPASAAAIIVQACDALAEAHACGLVHRDIKPANLMLASVAGELVVKVLDFGIACQTDAHVDRLTSTGDIVGSPTYMAPERMRPGVGGDARADVWSLGVVLYELVTGRAPFSTTSLPELCLQVMLDEPAPLPSDCPSALAMVVERCLRKDPSGRYPSAHEVAEALRAIATPTLNLSAADIEVATIDAAGHDILELLPEAPPRRRRWGLGVAGVSCVCAMLAILASSRSTSAEQLLIPPIPMSHSQVETIVDLRAADITVHEIAAPARSARTQLAPANRRARAPRVVPAPSPGPTSPLPTHQVSPPQPLTPSALARDPLASPF